MLTLLIPARNWSIERVHACVDSYIALGAPSLTEIIVVDFGSQEPVVLRDGMHPMARVLRLESKIMSVGEAINAGVLTAANEIIAKADADILISQGDASRAEFERQVADIASGKIGLAMCQATDLHQSIGVQEALDTVLAGKRPLGRLRATWGQGGLVFFSRAAWDAIGGLESRFTGWGNEDNDFPERIRRAGYPIRWADQDAMQIFHVWHPPTHALNGIAAHRQKNEAIARNDKSVFRSVAFRHSDFAKVAAPAVLSKASPLVTLSIATSARPGRLRMIREAIDSFRGQIDHDFEIFVADNGSTEEEVADLRKALGKIRWADGLIRLETTSRASIPGARNLITAEARGRYTCVVDDDDMAFSNRLADHLKNFEANGQLHGSHGGWIDFDETTGVIERNGGKKRTLATLLFGTGKKTAHPACFYRTDVLRAIPYDESFALGSDLDLALRMATLGLEIGHTGSTVTLRRFHETNVTITGTSNQASNGAAARARALATHAWNTHAALKKSAVPDDKEIYNRNQMSFDTLTEIMPSYTGEWHVYVPFEDLSRPAPAQAMIEDRSGAPEAPVAEDAMQVTEGGEGGDVHVPTVIERLGEIVDGTLCTRRSGLNQPVFFRSAPIKTLKKARKVREEVSRLLGKPVQMGSVRQAQIDRAVGFKWDCLPTGSGERRLQSERFESLGHLFVATRGIDREALSGKILSIVSDYDDEAGENYFLVTPNVKGYETVVQLQHDLGHDVGFFQVAGNGTHTELTMGSRSH